MLRSARSWFLLVVMLGCLSMQVFAADPMPMMRSIAPAPVQIMTAKKVFIANNTGENSADDQKHGQDDRSYNLFYAAMRSWGRYQLVSSPAAADLIFDLDLIPGVSGGRFAPDVNPRLSLTIVDPGTHAALWTLAEYFGFSTNNYPQAMAALVQDVKNLSVRAEAQVPSDANIATIMTMIGQIELDFAKTALNKSKTPALHSFAEQMVSDNTAMQQSIQKLNLKPAGNYTSDWLAGQSDKVKDRLASNNGKSFERYYVADEIEFDQTIATMIEDTLLPNAHDPDLKAVLSSSETAALAHLDAVQKLMPVIDPPPKDND